MNVELVTSVFLLSVASGVIPFINSEAIVIAAVVASPDDVYAFAVASTVGQMLAKVALYVVARWIPERLPERAKRRLDEASAKVEKVRGAGWTLVFVSALTGLPPFYVVSLAAGVVKMSMLGMVIPGTLGRLIRFVLIARFTPLFKALFESSPIGVVAGVAGITVVVVLAVFLRRRRLRAVR